MREMNLSEVQSVAGAVITQTIYDQNYVFYVPSFGIAESDYQTIEKTLQQALNKEISWSQFDTNLSQAGISRNSIDAYMINFDYGIFLQ